MTSKSSPPKPWEVRKSTPASNSVPVSSTVARSALEPTDNTSGLPMDSSSGRNPHIASNANSLVPRVPPRPLNSSYGGYNSPYNRYGSSYGGSYGSGSSYGGSYGSGYGNSYGSGYGNSYGSGYGSSYGSGYGSGYGNSYGSSYGSPYGYGGGYGRYGLGYRDGAPREGGPQGSFQNVLDGGYNQMNRFGAVVESFSRFSRLLDANFDALHGSFASVLRLLDVFGEFFYVVRTFAVFRLLFGGFGKGWQLLNLVLGRDVGKKLTNGNEGIEIDDYKKFQANQRKRSFPMFIMMAIIVATLPLLFIKMWRAIKKMNLLEGLETVGMDEVWGGNSSGSVVRAKFHFAGETEMDLPFREGDIIKVTGKPFPDWWEGEINGRKGLFPSNFVEQVIEEEPPK